MFKILAMMPCLSILTRAADKEASIKKSVWLNNELNSHQTRVFQEFNPCWRDESFVFLSKKQKVSKRRGKISNNAREMGK